MTALNTRSSLKAIDASPDAPGLVAGRLLSGEDAQLARPHDPFGIYLHIPFCEKKCPYCDFNTYAGMAASHQATVDALCGEMERWAPLLGKRAVSTIFVGGGTPTVLTGAQLQQLFTALHATFAVLPDCEITCEANPGTVDREKFHLLRTLGVNRLSLGVQSFQPDELTFLGRIHNVEDVRIAYQSARDAGFDNINLDFIFGLPHQSITGWRDTLAQAIALQPEHLSAYSLIVEENTPLHHWVESGRVDAPDEDLAAELYEIAMETLAVAGYRQYEVSNWARRTAAATETLLPSLASQHNLLYWRNAEYLGIGPGAHSHLRLRGAEGESVSHRWGNRKPVPGYVRRVETGQSVQDFCEVIDAATAMAESMMVGLRLVDAGVDRGRFLAHHGVDCVDYFAPQIAALQDEGLLVATPNRVQLTERGKMMGNQVFLRFLPDVETSSVSAHPTATMHPTAQEGLPL
jgi:oxygen-independent coproporphyrinogen-3 oxidase